MSIIDLFFEIFNDNSLYLGKKEKKMYHEIWILFSLFQSLKSYQYTSRFHQTIFNICKIVRLVQNCARTDLCVLLLDQESKQKDNKL